MDIEDENKEKIMKLEIDSKKFNSVDTLSYDQIIKNENSINNIDQEKKSILKPLLISPEQLINTSDKLKIEKDDFIQKVKTNEIPNLNDILNNGLTFDDVNDVITSSEDYIKYSKIKLEEFNTTSYGTSSNESFYKKIIQTTKLIDIQKKIRPTNFPHIIEHSYCLKNHLYNINGSPSQGYILYIWLYFLKHLCIPELCIIVITYQY